MLFLLLALFYTHAFAQSLSQSSSTCVRSSIILYTSGSETFVVTDLGSNPFNTPTICPNVTAIASTVYDTSTITLYQQPTTSQQISATPTATGAVVVTDNGFEDGAAIPFNSSVTSSGISAEVKEGGAGGLSPYDGTSFLLITFNTSSPAPRALRRQSTSPLVYNATQFFNATSGTAYTLSAFATAGQNGESPADCSITICGDSACGPSSSLRVSTYTRYSYVFNALVTERDAIATFSISCSGPAYVALDDVSISSGASTSSPAVMTTTVIQSTTQTVTTTVTQSGTQTITRDEISVQTEVRTSVLPASTIVTTQIISGTPQTITTVLPASTILQTITQTPAETTLLDTKTVTYVLPGSSFTTTQLVSGSVETVTSVIPPSTVYQTVVQTLNGLNTTILATEIITSTLPGSTVLTTTALSGAIQTITSVVPPSTVYETVVQTQTGVNITVQETQVITSMLPASTVLVTTSLSGSIQTITSIVPPSTVYKTIVQTQTGANISVLETQVVTSMLPASTVLVTTSLSGSIQTITTVLPGSVILQTLTQFAPTQFVTLPPSTIYQTLAPSTIFVTPSPVVETITPYPFNQSISGVTTTLTVFVTQTLGLGNGTIVSNNGTNIPPTVYLTQTVGPNNWTCSASVQTVTATVSPFNISSSPITSSMTMNSTTSSLITASTSACPTVTMPASIPCNSTYVTADGYNWLVTCSTDRDGDLTRKAVSSMAMCIQACDDYGTDCQYATWVISGQDQQWCYLKKRTTNTNYTLPSNIQALVVRRLGNSTISANPSGSSNSTSCKQNYILSSTFSSSLLSSTHSPSPTAPPSTSVISDTTTASSFSATASSSPSCVNGTIVNGNFEQGTFANWTTPTGNSVSDLIFGDDSGSAAYGSYYANMRTRYYFTKKVSRSTSFTNTLYQDVSSCKGTRYSLTYDYQCPIAYSAIYFSAFVYYYTSNGTNVGVDLVPNSFGYCSNKNAGTWYSISPFNFTSKDTVVRVFFQTVVSGATDGTKYDLYIDNVALTQFTSPLTDSSLGNSTSSVLFNTTSSFASSSGIPSTTSIMNPTTSSGILSSTTTNSSSSLSASSTQMPSSSSSSATSSYSSSTSPTLSSSSSSTAPTCVHSPVVNGNFEAGSMTGFTKPMLILPVNAGAGSYYGVNKTTGFDAARGNYIFTQTITAGQSTIDLLDQPSIKICAATAYFFSFDYQCSVSSISSTQLSYLYFYDASNNYYPNLDNNIVSFNCSSASPGVWYNTGALAFIAPAGMATIDLQMRFHGLPQTSMYYDNINIVPQYSSGNLIINGDFETGSLGKSWQDTTNDGTTGTGIVTSNTGSSARGSYVFKQSSSNNENSGNTLTQSFAIVGNTKYILSFDYEFTDSDKYTSYTTTVQFYNEYGTPMKSQQPGPTLGLGTQSPSTWLNTGGLVFTSPAGAVRATISLTLATAFHITSIYVDNIVLIPQPQYVY